MHQRAVLATANRFVHHLALVLRLGLDLYILVDPIPGHDERLHRLTDGLVPPVAENHLCGGIPVQDDPLRRCGD